ncbi:MAG: AAA family ATPase [Vicinamibacteria bacterium]
MPGNDPRLDGASASRTTEHDAPTLDASGLVGQPERPGFFEPGSVVNGRYRVGRLLGRGGMGAVYQVDDQLYPGRPTALKLFLHRPTHPVDLFRAEFRTMASLRHPNVASVYDFETVAGREAFFFTMELLAGTSLSACFRNDPRRAPGLPWQDVVDLLVPVIRALSYLHKRGVVHFDLKPSNIVVGSPARERRVKVLDFGLAGLRQEGDGWVGTPLYLSPEIAQTGRGDHRADLYSLGVMAYQLLSGEEPFDTTGSFERLLRQKLSEPVRFSGTASASVPAWLQTVVERLCAIEPGGRHATASELLDDVNAAGGLRYELETRDTQESYLFSSRFVGRRRELEEIQRCVTDAHEGRGIGALLVAGKSGMGKSRLMREVRQGVQLEGVAFAEADCFEGDLSEAGPMASLVLQAASLARSARAHDLLATHGPELVKLVPALSQGGELVPTPPLENAAAERRRMLEAAARFFVGLGQRIPYVLYVNDLQWARDGTIDLLAEIVHERARADSERSAVAVLGSYRVDEVAERPIRRLVDARPPAVRVPTLELLPLQEAEVEELLRSMLGLTALPAGLGAGVAASSGGLPFFVEEILRDLLEQGKLHLARGEWTVERGDGEELRFDAAASFVRRSARVTPGERQMLDLLAVCGRPAEPEVLASVAGAGGSAARDALRALIDRQMAVAIAGEREHYNLAHDRMREALYASLPAASRSDLHLRLARTFAAELTGDERGERLFETVGHFEQAEPLLTGEAERREVARLHLRAALVTNAAGAFDAGVRYLERAQALSGARPFESDYPLALAIEHALAASLVPLGRIDEALLAAGRIVANARSVLDEAPGWQTRILAHTARNEYDKAIDAGIAICGRLGLSLPRRPTRLGIAWALLGVSWRLRGRTDQELASLPPMDDARAMRLTRILTSMTACAYVNEPNLWPIIIARCLTLMLRHGRGPTHALLFAWFGTALAAVGAFGRARRFARLSVRLMDAPDGAAFVPKLHHAMGQFLSHWSEPISRTVEWCRSGFTQGERVEDAEFAGYCHMGWAKASLEAGEPLAEVHAICKAALATIQASGQRGTELMHLPSLQAVENLLGLAPHRARLAGPHYDDDARVRAGLSKAQNGFRLLEKARLACLFRQSTGLALGDDLVQATKIGLPATFYMSIGRYFACLVWLRECHAGASWLQRTRALARVALARRTLRRWALRCPESFDHRYLLVEAERLRALRKAEQAAAAYHHAIAAAKRGGFLQDAALAEELAAEHHLSQGDSVPAQAHLRAALAGYRQWGASAKVEDLLARYPGL